MKTSRFFFRKEDRSAISPKKEHGDSEFNRVVYLLLFRDPIDPIEDERPVASEVG